MSRFFRQEFPSDIITRFAMAVGFPEAQGIGRTARWMYFMMASAILSEEVHDVQKRSFRTLAIEITCMFSPHVLERLHDSAIALSINDDLFSFLIFWRVDRDAYGNASLVRDGPPAPARNALSENGSAYLIENKIYYDIWPIRPNDDRDMSTLYYEGCIAIVTRNYAWFLRYPLIPSLEGVSEEMGVSEEDVSEEDDSEEDR